MLTRIQPKVIGRDGIELFPIEGRPRQAVDAWRAMHRNRGYLANVLPGVVEANKTPLATYRRHIRLVERTDREGFLITDTEDNLCIGAVTLLARNRTELQGHGVQIDYWIDRDIQRRQEVGLQVAHLALDRARDITDQMYLTAPPHALLMRDLDKDPSGELSKLMMKVSAVHVHPEDRDFNGLQDESLDVWRDFNIEPKIA